MATVRIRADFGPVHRLLARLQKFIRNPRPALLGIAAAFERTARQSFERETSPEGARWAPLEISTLVAKARAGKGSQGILRFSGALLRTTIGGVTPDNRIVFVGSSLPHAAIHQFGGIAGRRPPFKKEGGRRPRIPARPFLPSKETAERIAVQVLEEQLQDVINQGGR